MRAKRKPSNAMVAIVGCAEAERAGVCRIGGVSTRHLSETGPHEQRFRDHPHLIVFLRYVLCMHGLDFSAAQAVFRKLSSRRIVFKAIDGQTDHMRWISTCTIRKSMVLTWYGHNTIELVLV